MIKKLNLILPGQATALQSLFLSGSFSVSLLLFRMFYTGSIQFIFLGWNLFLAFIPWLLSVLLPAFAVRGKWAGILTMLAWLLFVPNTFYILTDLIHLDMNVGMPLWFDLALLLSFAWTGLLFGIYSISNVETVLELQLGRPPGLFFLLPVMALNGLGVYVGRYLRFNSWDVLANPLALTRDIFDLFLHPLSNKLDLGMILCYTGLMTVMYLGVMRRGENRGTGEQVSS